MRTGLLFSIIAFYSGVVLAQTSSNRLTAKEMLGEGENLEDVLPSFNAKVLQDRQFMSDAIVWLYGLQKVSDDDLNTGRVKSTQDIFNEKDSEILEKNIEMKRMHYDLADGELAELLEKVEEDPAESFKSFMMSSSMPKLTRQELDEINTVDKKAIVKRLELMTDSGPDFGANQVSVMYLNEN